MLPLRAPTNVSIQIIVESKSPRSVSFDSDNKNDQSHNDSIDQNSFAAPVSISKISTNNSNIKMLPSMADVIASTPNMIENCSLSMISHLDNESALQTLLSHNELVLPPSPTTKTSGIFSKFNIFSNPSSSMLPEPEKVSPRQSFALDGDIASQQSPSKSPSILSKLNRGSSFRKAVNALKTPITKTPQPSPTPIHNRSYSVRNSKTKTKEEFDVSNMSQKRHLSVPKDMGQMQVVDKDLLSLLGNQGPKKVSRNSSMASINESTKTSSASSLLDLEIPSKSLISGEKNEKAGVLDHGTCFQMSDPETESFIESLKETRDGCLKSDDNNKSFPRTKIIQETTMEEDKSILLKNPSYESLEVQTCRRDSERRGEETLMNTLLNKNVTLTYRGDVIREQLKQQDSTDGGENVLDKQQADEMSKMDGERNQSPTSSDEVVKILVGNYGSKDSTPPIFHDAKPIVTIEPPSPMPEGDNQSYIYAPPIFQNREVSFHGSSSSDDDKLAISPKRQRRPTKWLVEPLVARERGNSSSPLMGDSNDGIVEEDLMDSNDMDETSSSPFTPPLFQENQPIVTIEPPTPMSASVAEGLSNYHENEIDMFPFGENLPSDDMPSEDLLLDDPILMRSNIDLASTPNIGETMQQLHDTMGNNSESLGGIKSKQYLASSEFKDQIDYATFKEDDAISDGKEMIASIEPNRYPEECIEVPLPCTKTEVCLSDKTNVCRAKNFMPCKDTSMTANLQTIEQNENAVRVLEVEKSSCNTLCSSIDDKLDVDGIETMSVKSNDQNSISAGSDNTSRQSLKEDGVVNTYACTDCIKSSDRKTEPDTSNQNDNNNTFEDDSNVVEDILSSARSRLIRCVSLPPKLCPLLITNNTSRFLNIMSRKRTEFSNVQNDFDSCRFFRCSCRTCLKSSLSAVSKSLPNLNFPVFLSPHLAFNRSCPTLDQEKSSSCSKIFNGNSSSSNAGDTKTQDPSYPTGQTQPGERVEENDKSPESDTGCSPPKGMLIGLNTSNVSKNFF